jgi:hypothetical protein
LPIIVSVILAVLMIAGVLHFIDSSVLVDIPPSKRWGSLVNLNHNGFHAWRYDDLTGLIHRFLKMPWIYEKSVTGLALLFLGSLLIVWNIRSTLDGRASRAIILSCMPVALVVLSVGCDPVVIGALAWVPIMSLLILRAMTVEGSILGWAALVVIGFENCLSANQAAPLSAAAAFGLATILFKNRFGARMPSADTWVMLLIVLLLPAFLTAGIAPTPAYPHYPKSAHIVPFGDLDSSIQPLLGATLPFDTLYRPATRALYGFCGAVLFAAGIVLFVFGRPRYHPFVRPLLAFGTASAGLVLLDTQLSGEWSLIAPLASVSRILPWGTHFSVASIVAGAAAWSIGVGLIASRRALLVTIITCLGFLFSSYSPSDLYHPELRRRGLINNPHIQLAIRSPSALLIRLFAPHDGDLGAWLHQIRAVNHLNGKAISEISANVSISPSPTGDVLALASSSEKYFRWSPRKGFQQGDETLAITFTEPRTIHGIELDPREYFTDFPRGLRVTGGECDSRERNPILFEANPWQGSLKLTARGIPYLTPRNQVRVTFSRAIQVKCLFIQQTGHAPYDWSIADIRVIE